MFIPTMVKKESPKHKILRTGRNDLNHLIFKMEQIKPEKDEDAYRHEQFIGMLYDLKPYLEDMIMSVNFDERM